MKIDINPLASMEMLSQLEVQLLQKTVNGKLYELFRNCSLAVLKAGALTDDSRSILEQYSDFDINVIQRERGVKLELINPPQDAIVDGSIIRNTQANLFSVLRDIVFINSLLQHDSLAKLYSQNGDVTNLIFMILRHACALPAIDDLNLVVCWGGHSVNAQEYEYARELGFQLGLRELNICTGCGTGIMEAPMRGAAAGHAQQRFKNTRFIGISEPSIIACEPPNALVNELIIMPDIEKRLEAFVRLGHSILIFPGGPGTAEEFLYLLGIFMAPENDDLVLPVILTGPASSADYFATLDEFVVNTLGKKVRRYYEVVIDDTVKVAQLIKQAMPKVKAQRLKRGDSYSFNWTMKIAPQLQSEFKPTHTNMAQLDLHLEQEPEQLAINLRRAFSGIVAGNIKPDSINLVKQHGPYQLNASPQVKQYLDRLLNDFIEQGRMKLPSDKPYQPSYQLQVKEK